MKSLSRKLDQRTRRHSVQTVYAGTFVTLGAALFGGCTLDTRPGPPSRRAAEWTQSPLDAPEASTTVLAPTSGAAGAQALAAPPSAANATPKLPEAPAAGSPEPDEDDDNSESSEAEPNACRPGLYTGLINGTVNLGAILPVSTLAGTINLELVADAQQPDVLVVQKGRVEGVDNNQSKFSANVTGAVNCVSGQLLRSGVERGTYEDSTLPIPIGFAGAAKGQYTTEPPALVGTWNVSDDTTLIAGQGTWSTTLSDSL